MSLRPDPTRFDPCPWGRPASPGPPSAGATPPRAARPARHSLRDAGFADLFPRLGRPGLPPWRLALVTVLQFRENLPDRQAAEAVRARIDRKHLLGLELADPGFDHSVLCEFRARLLEGGAEERLLHSRAPGPCRPSF